MKTSLRRTLLLAVSLPALAWAGSAAGFAQAAKPAFTLEKQDVSQIRMANLPESERSLIAKLPPNVHEFGAATVGEIADIEELTLKFTAEVKLTGIASTPDFKVESGGSCSEGAVYQGGTSCRLLVRFTPQGPGHRFGRLNLTSEGIAKPMSLGLSGYGYAPVISFTPAYITTVPGSAPSGGLLNGAFNLAVDNSDTLYIADTGNNVIRYLDSSAAFKTIASTGVTDPVGIAVDTFGEVYFSETSANAVYEIYDYGPVVEINGTGTDTCQASAPCQFGKEAVSQPGAMSMDSGNNLFFVNGASGAAFSTVQPVPATFINLYNPFTYQGIFPNALAVDPNDNIYTPWTPSGASGNCEILVQTLYSAENGSTNFNKIAGGRTCGFSGDGGEAGNAEIGDKISQMDFDLAGNLYFSDTANQRVRRVDAATGIINTIAGDGLAGYSGDGGPATKAALSSPTGVGVDSQGQVYILSGIAATGTGQVVRKLGPFGALSFGNELRGSASAALPVTVSNTGNSEMILTNAIINGANPADFAIDPNTTSCALTQGSILQAAQSCKIGIIFKPVASGARYANLVFNNNTVTNSNTVMLSGVGTLPVPTVAFTAPAASAVETSGVSFPVTVTVTSTTAPVPTGTVKFTANGTQLGGLIALSSGTATINVTETTTGSYTLAATYSGDTNYAAAGPVSRAITVAAAAVKPASKVTLKAKANPVTTCQSVQFTVAVDSGAATKATGKVELMEGAKVVATAMVSNGSATFTVPKLAAGAHMLTAMYLGDSEHAASSSPVFKETVRELGLCNDFPKFPTLTLNVP